MKWIEDEDIRAALKEMRTYIDITEEDLKKIFDLAMEHARRRLKKRIPVSLVMTRDVITVKRDMSLKDLARLLTEKGISGVPVVDDLNRVIGIVTEADIIFQTGQKRSRGLREFLRELIGEPHPKDTRGPLSELRVGDIMSTPVITATPDMDIRDVAVILAEKRIKRMPVVDSDGRLIGIISRQDIVRAVSHES
jgi:CBS domain-containing membrane protein